MKMEELEKYWEKKVEIFFIEGNSYIGILSGTESEENEEGEYTGRELVVLDLTEHSYISFLPEEIEQIKSLDKVE
ncbi:hypothetical protein FSBG_00074 [Fusobacterium gonidiaformans 3-1-5R]|uniref:Uncharacterized protein n=1 Tax=Fusobacterium gonidiaformans 3-1-5R TaxID=469605 RepID=E5BEP6_9FUSO|nr:MULTISPECIES: hypothetical protein [Fusobacterium]EFS20577.1 hypothetical protein FSBG_00074 [Fusobacterium gonidiaformans 3-1-5R]MBR8733096.1 hypothetical protein [Fusobacterium necrophorum]MBR8789360.1 hypothetical protein [Fusobacterium necrophorum]MCF0163283.1 hypothetical protein [Fusobacterium necrophorum]MCI7343825.1 hypothetical protein [Fusobacterium necrophorum]